MPGKNPNVGKKPFDQFLLLYQNVQQRERVQKVKVDLPNPIQNNPIKSAVNCSQIQP